MCNKSMEKWRTAEEKEAVEKITQNMMSRKASDGVQ